MVHLSQNPNSNTVETLVKRFADVSHIHCKLIILKRCTKTMCILCDHISCNSVSSLINWHYCLTSALYFVLGGKEPWPLPADKTADQWSNGRCTLLNSVLCTLAHCPDSTKIAEKEWMPERLPSCYFYPATTGKALHPQKSLQNAVARTLKKS